MTRKLLTAVLLLAAAGCPRPEAPAGPRLDPPDWAEREIAQYWVAIAGDTVGQHIVQLNRTEYEGTAALELVVETMAHIGGYDTHDSAWAMIRLDDLRPLHTARSIANAGFSVAAEVRYAKDTARATAMAPGGPQSAEIPLGPFDFDHEQAVQLIRALPLAPGEQFDFNVVVGIAGTKFPAAVSLVGTESVTVPVGTFDCRRVKLAVAGQAVDIWYEAGGLRRMVRYVAPDAELEMELAASIID